MKIKIVVIYGTLSIIRELEIRVKRKICLGQRSLKMCG
jgi:hypothetical protein